MSDNNLYEIKINLEGNIESLKRQLTSLNSIWNTIKNNSDAQGNISSNKAVINAVKRNKKVEELYGNGQNYSQLSQFFEQENKRLEQVLQDRIKLLNDTNVKIEKIFEQQTTQRKVTSSKKKDTTTIEERWNRQNPRVSSNNWNTQQKQAAKKGARGNKNNGLQEITPEMVNPALDSRKGFRQSSVGIQAKQQKIDANKTTQDIIKQIQVKAQEVIDKKEQKEYEKIYKQIIESYKKDELQLNGIKPRGKNGNYSQNQINSVVLDDLQLKQIEQISRQLLPGKNENANKLSSLLQQQLSWGGYNKTDINKSINNLITENSNPNISTQQLEKNKKRIVQLQQQLEILSEIENLIDQTFTKEQGKSVRRQISSSMQETKKSIERYDDLEAQYQKAYFDRKKKTTSSQSANTSNLRYKIPENVDPQKIDEYNRLQQIIQQKIKNATPYKDYLEGKPIKGNYKSYKKADEIIGMSSSQLSEEEQQRIFEEILTQPELTQIVDTYRKNTPKSYKQAYIKKKSYPTFVNEQGEIIRSSYEDENGNMLPSQSYKIVSPELAKYKLSNKSLYQLEDQYLKLQQTASNSQATPEEKEEAKKISELILHEILIALNNSVENIDTDVLRNRITGKNYSDGKEDGYINQSQFFEDLRGKMVDRPSSFEAGLIYDADRKEYIDQNLYSQERSQRYDPIQVRKDEDKELEKDREYVQKQQEQLKGYSDFIDNEKGFSDALQKIFQEQGSEAAIEFVKVFVSQIKDTLRGNEALIQENTASYANVELTGRESGNERVYLSPDYVLQDELEDDITDQGIKEKEIGSNKNDNNLLKFLQEILRVIQNLRNESIANNDIKKSEYLGQLQQYIEKNIDNSNGKNNKTIEQNFQESFNRMANILERAKVTDYAIEEYSRQTGIDTQTVLDDSFKSGNIDTAEARKSQYDVSKKVREKFDAALISQYGDLETAEIKMLSGDLSGLDRAISEFFSVRDKEIEEVYKQVQQLKGDPEAYQSFKESLVNQLYHKGSSVNENSYHSQGIKNYAPIDRNTKLSDFSIKQRFIGGYGQGQFALAPYGANNVQEGIQEVNKRINQLLQKEEFTEQDNVLFDKLTSDLALFESTLNKQQAEYAGISQTQYEKQRKNTGSNQQSESNNDFIEKLNSLLKNILQQKEAQSSNISNEKEERKENEKLERISSDVQEIRENRNDNVQDQEPIEDSTPSENLNNNNSIPPIPPTSSNLDEDFNGSNNNINIKEAVVNIENGKIVKNNNSPVNSGNEINYNDMPFTVEDYNTLSESQVRNSRSQQRRVDLNEEYRRWEEIRSPNRNGVFDTSDALESLRRIDEEYDFQTHTLDNQKEAIRQYNQELKNQIKYLGEVASYSTKISLIEQEIEQLEEEGAEKNKQEIVSLKQQLTLLQSKLNTSRQNYELATNARERTQVDQQIQSGDINQFLAGQVEQLRTNAQIEAERVVESARITATEDFNRRDITDQTKLVKQYLSSYKEKLKIEREIERVNLSMQNQNGEDLKNSQKLLESLQNQRAILQGNMAIYDNERGLLNNLELTDSNRLMLQQEINNLNAQHETQLVKINNQQKEQESLLEAIVGGLRASFRNLTDYTIAYEIIGQIKNTFNSIIEATKQLDANLVDIRIASGMTAEEVHNVLVDYSDLANELGRTTSDVATAANDWLRAGYEGEKAADLTKASMELSALGMIDAADATTYLISTLKGWKLSAEEVEGVVDKLTAVDMAAAISAGDLALAMSRANNSARLAGSGMNEFIGYVTTVADVTQKSAESVGESFKTIYSRFGNVAAGKYVASTEDMESADYNEDEWENLNDIEKVLDKVGIKLKENATTYREIDDILSEIAEKWDSYDDVTQNALATAIAGTRQRENVLTLFENWDSVEKYTKIAAQSAGTAAEKMEAYIDSIEASQNRVTVAIEKWALAFQGSDLIKKFYDTISFVIRNFHTLGAIIGTLIIAANSSKVIFTSLNNIAGLSARFASLDLMIQKTITSLRNNQINTGMLETAKTYLNENYISAQQRLYAEALSRYTVTLDQAQAQYALSIQNMGINLEKESKLLLSKILLGEVTDEEIATKLRSIPVEERKIIVDTLLSNLTDEEIARKREQLGIETSLSDEEAKLLIATQQLKEIRQKQYAQGIGRNLSASANLPTAGKAAILGGASVVGGISGGIIGLSVGSQFGDTAQIFGSIGGSLLGSYAIKGIAKALAGAGASSLAGPIGALAALVIGGAWSALKKQQEEYLEEIAQEYQDIYNQFQEKSSSITNVSEYDELVKGVDRFGKNVSLTNEEYDNFLNISNELAKLYPELVVYTDEFGNAFLGTNGKISAVSDSVNSLIEQLKHLSNQKLLDPAMFESEYEKSQEQYLKKDEYYNKLNDLNNISSQINSEGDLEIIGDPDLIREFVEKYNKEFDASLTSFGGKLSISQRDNDAKKIQDFLQTFIGEETLQIREELKLISDDFVDQTNAIIEESDLYEDYKNLSQEQQNFVSALYQGTSKNSDIDSEEYKNNVIKNAEEAIKFIEENPAYLDIIYSYNGNMSGEEYQKAINDFINSLKEQFPDMETDEFNNILLKFGLIYDSNLNKYVSEDDNLSKIFDENLNTKLSDNGTSLGSYSVDDLKYIYDILKNTNKLEITQSGLDAMLFNKKYGDSGLKQLVEYYEYFKELEEDNTLTEKEKEQYEIIKSTMDLWADQLGLIEGKYDAIVEKTKMSGDLTIGGTSELTYDQIQEKISGYQELYEYLNSEDFTGAWDREMLNTIASDENLIPFLNDPDGMKNKLEELLNDGDDLYRNYIEGILITTEEGSQYILNSKKEEVERFGELYNIDLNNFSTLKAAEQWINEYTSSLLIGDYNTWLSAMATLYGKDLENFTNAVVQKQALNKMIMDSLNLSDSEKQELALYEQTLGNSQEGYSAEEVQDKVSEKLFEIQQKKLEQSKDGILGYKDQLVNDLQDIIDTDFDIEGYNVTDSTGSTSDDGLTDLERLQKYRELIDKEWEAMEAYNEKDKTYRPTEYFNKMRKALNAEIAETLRLMNQSNLTEEQLLDYEADLIELQKSLNNLDDEEREDQIKLLETKEASIKAMIEQQKLYIETADTEEELIERQKELNDLIKDEYDMRRSIRSFLRESNDFKLSYLSGTAYSNSKEYDKLMQESLNTYKEDAKQAVEEIQRALKEAHNQYITEVDAQGNRLYTDSQAWDLAEKSEEVQELTKEYMEAIQGQAETIIQGVNDKLEEISNNISDLEKMKPQQWTSIDQIKEFSESTISELEKKIPILQDALKDTSILSDEQIQDLVNQLNDVTVALHEAQIEMRQNIKDYQDSQYDAIVSKVEQYKEEIEDIMDDIEDAYDKEIGKLEDANDERERAIELTDLLKAKENAANEKERVYREGIGWVYESNRDKIKEADQDLKDFYQQDKIDDLEATKDKELEILQERIDAWDLYLEALEWRYTEYDRMEQDRLLKQLLNVETEEEIRDRITNDMINFNATCEGSYKQYIGIFTDFLDSYEENLIRLGELQQKQLQILSQSAFLNQNAGNNATGGLIDSDNFYFSDGVSFDINADYHAQAIEAAKRGDWASVQDILDKRDAKTDFTGNDYGQSSDEIYNDLWNKYGNSGSSSGGSSSSSNKGSSNGSYNFHDKVEEVNNSIGKPGSNLYWKSYSNGLDSGPVTYTGLAMLHGSVSKPEYVLNNDQAYNLLKYLTTKPLEYEKAVDKSNNISYIVQGDIVLEDVENPANFWDQVTRAMGNRWSVTKNK